jgi:hypothetical protein
MVVANKKFVVKLSSHERKRLRELISKGRSAARNILKARILLKADQSDEGEGWPDEKICEALHTNIAMVTRVRSKLVNDGLDAVFIRKKRQTPPIQPIFDGERQAKLIALACSKPPLGYARWTLRLLAEKVVEREIVTTAHFNTVGRALKKRYQAAHEGILGGMRNDNRTRKSIDGRSITRKPSGFVPLAGRQKSTHILALPPAQARASG